MAQHLDPDRLVLLALSEAAADTDESVHLAGCPGCNAEIDELRHVAELGAATQGLRALPPPPERVWAGIEAAVGAPVRRLPQRRERRWALPVLAAAVAVLAIAGTVVVQRFPDRPQPPAVTAKASLSRLGSAPVAAGSMSVSAAWLCFVGARWRGLLAALLGVQRGLEVHVRRDDIKVVLELARTATPTRRCDERRTHVSGVRRVGKYATTATTGPARR
jgi:hypothetical protein